MQHNARYNDYLFQIAERLGDTEGFGLEYFMQLTDWVPNDSDDEEKLSDHTDDVCLESE